MGKSVHDVNEEQKEKYGTKNNVYGMFGIGARVRAICVCQDFHFFDPETQNTYGTVVRNKGEYLGIIVKWDEPRHYESGHIQYEFNFKPDDLVLIQAARIPPRKNRARGEE